MDVVVWALWIWIALSAVALVVYVFRRVRYNRRQRAAVLNKKPLPSTKIGQKALSSDGKTGDSAGESLVLGTTASSPPLKKRPVVKAEAEKPATSKPDTKKIVTASTPAKPIEKAAEEPTEEPADHSKGASAGLSLGSLLAPRSEEPATGSDAPPAEADITLPADEEPDLDLNDATESSKTLADLLVGIRLPCDLMPVDDIDPDIAEVAVTLVTMTSPPETVGVMLADELERLGYAIFSLSDSEAVAKRDLDASGNAEDVLSLIIRTDVGPDGHGVANGSNGDALPSAVAVDMWVGGGESPLLPKQRRHLDV